jgi:hypothetical protein
MFAGAVALTLYIFVFKRIPLSGKQNGELSKFLPLFDNIEKPPPANEPPASENQ